MAKLHFRSMAAHSTDIHTPPSLSVLDDSVTSCHILSYRNIGKPLGKADLKDPIKAPVAMDVKIYIYIYIRPLK